MKDYEHYVWLAFLVGALTNLITFIVMQTIIKIMGKRNAPLMAECDYRFLMGKILYKTMSSEHQKEIDDDEELMNIRKKYHENINRIKKSGKY